ncbi:hypothetical protein Tco_0212404 [Tanacetum coccineum]
MRSSSSSSSRSRFKHYTKEEILARTHCDCPLPIEMQVTWTITNTGRRFKGCPIYIAMGESFDKPFFKDSFTPSSLPGMNKSSSLPWVFWFSKGIWYYGSISTTWLSNCRFPSL